MRALRVAAVVLAAGASRRLGRPKQTVVLGGETLVERAARVAREAEFSPVIVVVRTDGELAEALRTCGCDVAVNGQAAEGMASSIRCGIARARMSAADGAVLMACDQVTLRPEHLRALAADAGRIAGSGYAGRVGVPAYFPASSFDMLLELKGDEGARELLRASRVVIDEKLALDVDTEADVARAMESLHQEALSRSESLQRE